MQSYSKGSPTSLLSSKLHLGKLGFHSISLKLSMRVRNPINAINVAAVHCYQQQHLLTMVEKTFNSVRTAKSEQKYVAIFCWQQLC